MTKKGWIIIVIEALLFIVLLGTVTKCNNDKINILERNIDAYKDSVEYVTTQNLELIATKESLILSEAAMRDELDITKRELKDLKKKLGDDIAYISKLEAQLNIKDTLYMKPDTVYVYDSITTKTFNWQNKWFNTSATVTGTSICDSKLQLNNFNMIVPLKLGLTDDYRFWATSENPYITITDITAVAVENSILANNKRFHHGIYAGFGLSYGLLGKQLDVGPQLGYGFTYSF